MDRRAFLFGAATAAMTLPAVASEAKSYVTIEEAREYFDKTAKPIRMAQDLLHAANLDGPSGISHSQFHAIAQSQHSYEIYGKESRRIRQTLKVNTATSLQPKISSYDPEGSLIVVFYDYRDKNGGARRLSISYEYAENTWSMGWVSHKPLGNTI